MDYSKALGSAIRQHRRQAKLSQDELAHLAQVDRTYIGMLENAQCSPTVKILAPICLAMGVMPSHVLKTAEKILQDTPRL